MTREYFSPDPRHVVWFRKEQGRLLKEARLRADMSIRELQILRPCHSNSRVKTSSSDSSRDRCAKAVRP